MEKSLNLRVTDIYGNRHSSGWILTNEKHQSV